MSGRHVRSYIRDFRGYHPDIRNFLYYSLASNIAIGVFTLLFNLYLTALGRREDYIGDYNAVSMLAMAAIALSMGFMINRWGVWRCVTGGLAFFIAASALLCVVTDRTMLLVLAAFAGAGNAFLFVPTMPFIVDLTESHQRHGVAALAFSLNSLSITVGSLVGGWLPDGLGLATGMDATSALAYRITLLFGLALASLALIPLLAMSASRKRARPGDNEPRITQASHAPAAQRRNVRRDMLVFIAIGGLMSLGAGAVFPFYNVFLTTLGASAGQIGLVFSAAGLMAAGLGLLSPYIAKRLGALRAVTLVRLAPVPFYLLLMLTPALPIAIFGHMIRTTSINMAWPIDSTYISEKLPARARAQVFSFRSGAWNLGWSLASLIAGRAIVDYGYNVSFGAYVVFMTAGMGLFYIYFSRAERSADTLKPVDRSAAEAVAAGG
jgi:MFS family permease